jgi:hypothetical protein
MNIKAAMWATIIVVAVLAFIVILAISPTSILIDDSVGCIDPFNKAGGWGIGSPPQ